MMLHGCIMTLKLFLLLTVKFIDLSEAKVALFPTGQAPACHGEELQLTCNTTELYSYHMWSFIVHNDLGVLTNYTRGVSSIDGSQQSSHIVINSTSFDFLRVSSQGAPLITTMTINSVGDNLNGITVDCTGMGNFETMTARTAITIINESYHEQPEVHTRAQFEIDNATVTMELAANQEAGVSYNVSVFPQVVFEFVDNTIVQLRVAYNIIYNVSIVSTLCGRHSTTTKLELSYAKCRYPLVVDTSLGITGYYDPALEGATLTFSCPPRKILTGPNITMCMKNGEWEPDPQVKGIKCAANCGLPLFPRNGYGQIYLDNNTIEGARVSFICSNDAQHSLEQTHVAVCNPDGTWQPNPGNFCTGSKTTYTGVCDRVTTALVSSASVFLVISIVFMLIGFICGRLIPTKKFSPPSSECKRISATNPQSSGTGHVYETVTAEMIANYFPQQKVDLTENVAYDFVQPKTSKFVITA